MTQQLEVCCVCSEPTGRAGRGDDSIYRTLNQDFPDNDFGFRFPIKGEELGPLCSDCNEHMAEHGLFEEVE
jgi:hypothetical protein